VCRVDEFIEIEPQNFIIMELLGANLAKAKNSIDMKTFRSSTKILVSLTTKPSCKCLLQLKKFMNVVSSTEMSKL
jgi:hypothetical protein